jgi:diguanylate cyclase (GGDEF)-like protein
MPLSAKHLLSPFTLIPFLLFTLLFTFSDHMVDIEENRLKEAQRSQVLLQASAARAQLESELNATLHITTGLTGYVAVNPSLSGKRDVQKVLKTLFHSGHHLRNIGLAPGNILTHVYPVEGNEKAIGLNYEQHPTQWPAVKRAIESRSTVLAGPLNLVQGGRGLISRTPVFLDNGQYWGILSLVIDIDSLLSAAGLKSAHSEVQFALRGKDGLGKKGGIFLGQQEIFKQQPVLLDLTVPGGRWQMAAIPAKGWGNNLGYLKYYRGGAALISLVLSVMLWMILADRKAIKHMALHDSLTGLANRRLFNERLGYTLLQKQRQLRPFALIAIDLDNFKPINDHYGHKAGDEVLREIGRRLLGSVRQEDTVARLGGDEFMLILPSTGSKQATLNVANKLKDVLCKPFTYQDKELELSASIGICLYPEHGSDEEELLRSADLSMYQAKKEGKGRISIQE